MPYQYLPIPDVRTMAFVRVKIICFLILYLLTGTLILSLFIDKLVNLVALLDTPKWRIYFGLYLVITGISTAAISSWRGKVQTQQMARQGKVPEDQRDIYERAWKIANLIMGFVFIVEGILFGISGFGEINGWWPRREVFGSLLGRIVTLILLNFPAMVGSWIGNGIILAQSISKE